MAVDIIDGFDNHGLLALRYTLTGTTPPALTTALSATGVGAVAFAGTSQGSSAERSIRSSIEHATVIVGCRINPTLLTNVQLQLRSDAAATQHLTLVFLSTGAIEVRRGTSSGTLLGTTATGLVVANSWTHIGIVATLNDTTGAVTLYVNGVSVLALTNVDTKNAGTKTTFDAVRFLQNNSSGFWYLDDLYICTGAGSVNTTFLGDRAVLTRAPMAAGDLTGLTPAGSANNFENVDELPYSTTDYNASATVGATDLYQIGDIPTSVTAVNAVQVTAVGHKDVAGTRSIAPVLKSGGTVYEGASLALGLTPLAASDVYDLNPNGAVAWTAATTNALQAGARVTV